MSNSDQLNYMTAYTMPEPIMRAHLDEPSLAAIAEIVRCEVRAALEGMEEERVEPRIVPVRRLPLDGPTLTIETEQDGVLYCGVLYPVEQVRE